MLMIDKYIQQTIWTATPNFLIFLFKPEIYNRAEYKRVIAMYDVYQSIF